MLSEKHAIKIFYYNYKLLLISRLSMLRSSFWRPDIHNVHETYCKRQNRVWYFIETYRHYDVHLTFITSMKRIVNVKTKFDISLKRIVIMTSIWHS